MNKLLNEDINRIKSLIKTKRLNEGKVKLRDTNYSHLKFDMDGTQNDLINTALLDDLNEAGKNTGILITITTAVSGHNKYTKDGRISRHGSGIAVDIGMLNGIGDGSATDKNFKPEFRELGNKVKDYLVNNLGYSWNRESGNEKAVLWLTYIGGNHYNHLHVSNKNEEKSESSDVTTPTYDDVNKPVSDDQNIEKSEEDKLLEKILDSEYLGMKVKDWLEVSKDPSKLIEFVFKMLDF